MLLISQNAENYNIKLPKDAVFRINLAWCNSVKELEEKLTKNRDTEFFIDLPVGRLRPPNNRYSLNDLIPIIESNPHVRYFAISNVETENDLKEFLEKLPSRINIVPKIESINAIKNIDSICTALKTEKRMVMLDHDDLFLSIIRNKENKESVQTYEKKLIDYCKKEKISLLRTVGVIFTDDEKRTT